MNLTAASSRQPRIRLVLASLVGVLIAGLMALWMSAPAQAMPTNVDFTVQLLSKTGAALSGYDIYPIELQNGTAVGFQDPVAGEPVTGKPGYFSFSLVDSAQYTLLFSPTGANAASGAFQYLGGTPDVDGATTFIPSSTNTFLTATIATGATIKGKVTGPTGTALKGAEVDEYEYNGSQWVFENYTLTVKGGTYSFTNVDPGSYKFEFYPPEENYPPVFSGGASSLDAATPTFVSAGTTATVNQKFVAGNGAISGTAFIDFPDLGVDFPDMGAVASAYPVTSAVGASTTTIDTDKVVYGSEASSKGAWTIKNLPAGRYVVQMNSVDSQYLTGEHPNVRTADLDGASVYTVVAGHTLALGKTDFPEGEDALESLGAEPNITVTDASAAPIAGALVQVAQATAPNSYVYGTSPESGPTQLYFDADDTVALEEGPDGEDITETNFPLPPGWYDITVIDPTGAHGPQTLHTRLGFGETDIDMSLPTTTVTPAVDPGAIDSTDTSIGTKYTDVGAAAARDDATLGYQWLRDGRPIYGATSDTYTSTGGDLGTQLSVRVTASSFGYTDVSATASVGGDTPAVETEGAQIENATAPSIPGDGNENFGTVLRPSVGNWTINGAAATGLTYTYQWYTGDPHSPVAIEAATGSTYTVTPTDAENDAILSVQVTAHKTGFADSDAVSSNVVYGNPSDAPVNTTAPKVTSSTKGGVTTWSVSTGSWNQKGLTFLYSWVVGDTPIGTPGGTAHSITSTQVTDAAGPAPYANAILVLVTAQKLGYLSGDAFAVVKPGTSIASQVTAPVVTDETDTSTYTPSGSDPVFLGDVLKVTTPGVWATDFGTLPGTHSYQWLRNGVAIKGATSATYKVATADTSVDGTTELSVAESFVSPYAPGKQTAPKTDIAQVQNLGFSADAAATLSGPAIVGQKLSVSAAGWGVSGVSLSYSWWECSTDCTDSDNYHQVPGATKSSITVSADWAYIGGEVIAYKAGYGSSPPIDSAPATVEAAGSFAALSVPAISTTATVGVKLTSTAPKWSTTSVKNSYLWQVQECDPNACDDNQWHTISGATASTYTPTAVDFTDGAESIRVSITGTKGSATSVASSRAVHILPGTMKTLTPGSIKISGGNYVVTQPTYSVSGGSGSTTVYRDATPIASPLATDPSDAGKAIYADVYYGVNGYKVVPSLIVFQKGATTHQAETIGGAPIVGSVLSPTDVQPFVDTLNTPRTVSYQWSSNGKAISGTIGKAATFTPTSAYYGKAITVTLTGSSSLYATDSVTSSPVTIGLGSFGTPDAPVVHNSGTLEAGVKASFTTGNYGTSGVTLKEQWQRSTDGGATYTSISGATKTTYTPVATDGGDYLRVVVMASKTDYTSLPLTSDGVLIHYPADLASLGAPVLSGNAAVGGLLTVTSGSWNLPSLTYAYRWYRNGVLIPGVNGTSWTPTASSGGDEITVSVVASRTGYATVSAGSNAVSVTLAQITSISDPIVTASTDELEAGSVFRVTPGTWSVDGVTITYQWRDEDGLIAGATSDTYVATGDEPGEIAVVVTASRPGYLSASLDSGEPF